MFNGFFGPNSEVTTSLALTFLWGPKNLTRKHLPWIALMVASQTAPFLEFADAGPLRKNLACFWCPKIQLIPFWFLSQNSKPFAFYFPGSPQIFWYTDDPLIIFYWYSFVFKKNICHGEKKSVLRFPWQVDGYGVNHVSESTPWPRIFPRDS